MSRATFESYKKCEGFSCTYISQLPSQMSLLVFFAMSIYITVVMEKIVHVLYMLNYVFKYICVYKNKRRKLAVGTRNLYETKNTVR